MSIKDILVWIYQVNIGKIRGLTALTVESLVMVLTALIVESVVMEALTYKY